MSTLTATPKGAATREAILDRAYDMARQTGLEGLSIGPLAQAVAMSKSGVFAHFGSREDLQLAVLDSAADRFGQSVLIAALSQPRGLPRLRALMHNWFEWGRHAAGGCVLVGSVTEYDDRPGVLRDKVLHNEQRWRSALQRAAQLAIECGHLCDGDTDQYAFELYAIPLAMLHEAGLFGYERARRHGEAALEHWIISHPPTASP
jgi:AcrR family transcriptional regulator